jgi:hypothetical protein
MATFIVEVMVGGENVSLSLKEHGEGVSGIDTTPLVSLVGHENARQIGVQILSNLTMGEVEVEGEQVGWLAWMANYVEGSELSACLAEFAQTLIMGKA